jgi:transcriptional regulator with XRE-family HTH domain
MCDFLTEEDVRKMLQSEIMRSLSYDKFAKKHGMSKTTVSNAVNGKILPNAQILKALGLELVPRYRSVRV